LLAVGMQQHEIGAGVHQGGVRDLGPDGPAPITLARSTDVDDVIVVLDAFIRADVRRIDVEILEEEFFFRRFRGRLRQKQEGGREAAQQEREASEHGGTSQRREGNDAGDGLIRPSYPATSGSVSASLKNPSPISPAAAR